MDRMIYLAMTGAKQTMQAQTANSHNLANASTTGFRADLNAFSSDPVEGPGYASRVNAVSQGEGTDFSTGTMQSTGRALDIAVQGEGWIAVQGPDGGEAYTRAGDLQLTANGNLVNGSGHPVMGDGGHGQRSASGPVGGNGGRGGTHQAGESGHGQPGEGPRRAVPDGRWRYGRS
jgi:flagellar basal-body rod protein FlgF